MTDSHGLPNKRIIYVTPEEFSSLPSDGPIYVLSTAENPKPTSQTSALQSPSCSQSPLPTTSIGTGLTGSAFTALSVSGSNYFNNAPYAVPYQTNVIPYPPPPMISTNVVPPYGLCSTFQRPSYSACQPIPWLTSGFQNSTFYNPAGSVFPLSPQYVQPYHTFSGFQPSILPSPFIRTFNPYQPPPCFFSPQLTGNPDSNIQAHAVGTVASSATTATTTLTCIPTTTNTVSNTWRRPFSRSTETKGNSEPNNFKADSTPLKQLKPLRYTKLVYTSEPDFFTFDDTTGSYVATHKLIDLENQFENEVIARRHRATVNDPVRQPPERPVLSDSEHRRNSRASHLHKSKKSSRDSNTGNSLLDNIDSDGNPDENDDLVYGSDHEEGSEEMRLNAFKTKSRRGRKNKIISFNFESKCKLNNSALNRISQTVNGHSIGQRSIRQQREVAYKVEHPNRLHPDIWHNEANEFNDGPACSCKPKYRIGPLHNQYEGEQPIPPCIPESNNRDRLYHYRIIISPTTNFVQPIPSKITHNGNDYIFDGFSLFLHYKLDKPPPCQVLRFNLLYDIFPIEEEFPQYFTVRSLDLLTQYIFIELLELLDLSWKPYGVEESCSVIHLMPRFIRLLSAADVTGLSMINTTTTTSTTTTDNDNSMQHNPEIDDSIANCVNDSTENNNDTVGELLPVHVIMQYWLKEALTPVIDVMQLSSLQKMSTNEWSNYIFDLRGTLACFPGKKPAAIRIDQLDRQSVTGQPNEAILIYPLIVHMTYTPMKLSLTREPKYKCVLKNFMKLQYLMMNKPRISPSDRAQLVQLASELEEMEHSGVHRREVTVEISCEGFYRTGIRPDIPQHALNLVSLIAHLRFHKSLESLENRLGYTFTDKSLLHQSLTHPSYRRTNFGTNQDHFQNSLVTCGPRILEYGDKLELYKAWRKKGLTKMIQVMSFLPKMHEERSNIYGNERLEFLGDAVVEVISSIHLFFMFPELSEGHLDAYRQAIVQNQHLAELAVRLGIHKFLLYTHSVDFCYDSTFIYARSDAFEALMAAIALDAGLDVVDRIFGAVLFGDDERIHRVWVQIPPHPLQAQCPDGDRSWATKVPMLKKLCTLEDTLGIKFKHLRVLARAMTIRKTGFNFYTLGDNQRLEFLGDSLLKHHEGHLSLLKNSLVNKYTQASVCSELGLENYVIRREDNSMNQWDNKTNNNTGLNGNHTTTATSKMVMSNLPPKVYKGKRNKKGQKQSNHSAESNSSSNNNSCNPQNQNVKYRADLLEAFIGALFVDKDLTWVERFCQICFWPRLVEFILKQEWNDAKSKLQQCCLTFRSLNEDPEIAHYKVLEHSGPTNQRVYRVGVYFRGQRLATGQGRSVQQAQMEAAKKALELHQDTFRQLDFQRSVISRRYKQPYINKILNQVQNWDEQLVDYFIPDKNKTTATTATTMETVSCITTSLTTTTTTTTNSSNSSVSNNNNNEGSTVGTSSISIRSTDCCTVNNVNNQNDGEIQNSLSDYADSDDNDDDDDDCELFNKNIAKRRCIQRIQSDETISLASYDSIQQNNLSFIESISDDENMISQIESEQVKTDVTPSLSPLSKPSSPMCILPHLSTSTVGNLHSPPNNFIDFNENKLELYNDVEEDDSSEGSDEEREEGEVFEDVDDDDDDSDEDDDDSCDSDTDDTDKSAAAIRYCDYSGTIKKKHFSHLK
ncbi:unnamed protein product [Trichobilharzia szidati]|nr:unnamed protein product [Trichobilharzia szidati]